MDDRWFWLLFVAWPVAFLTGSIISAVIARKKSDEPIRFGIDFCRLRLDEMTVKLGVVLSILEQMQSTTPKLIKPPPDAILPESAFRTKPMG
jgi:hypothetical protein